VKSTERGFTLIEIIFVVFIIGMAVGVISISVGGNAAADMTRKEAEEFMLQASYIAEQSVLKGETHGLFVELRPAQDIDGQEQWCYQWRRVRDRKWQDLPELSQHCLAEGQKIDFVVEEELWEFDPELEYQDPVMGFFPSGDGSGEIEIAIYADQLPGGDTSDTEQFELELTGELRWVSEEKRVKEDQRGR
jgi:general secretion pathway protein H